MPAVERVALIALVALIATGCSRINRTRECTRLARTVNAALEEIEGLQQTSPNRPTTLRQVASRYDKLAKELNVLAFRDEQTKRDVVEYGKLFVETANLVGMAADAAERKDDPALVRARLELERLLRREKMQTMKIGNACNVHRG
jgi:hypothetical protein